jgi:DNA topoisomerase-1
MKMQAWFLQISRLENQALTEAILATSEKKKPVKSTSARAKAPAKKASPAVKKAPATSSAKTSRGGKSLVIVESPAKAKTLQKYLGDRFKIEASVGHVRDLPPSKLGVDVENDFEPVYQVMKGKEKVIDRITRSAATAEEIFLAPDPDREGEAIAWHIAQELHSHGIQKPIRRATFNEITKRAVEAAIANPTDLNEQLFEAQQARRILDRLVGYQISPLLWAKVTRGLSAGRVQSVAVRLVVEREREILAFTPEEYWSLEALVSSKLPPPFEMKLTSADGSKPVVASAAQARALLDRLGASGIDEQEITSQNRQDTSRKLLVGKSGATWTVSSVDKKDVKRHPAPPFITSTLQQEAGRKMGFGAKKTMSVAQKLYEGVELGSEGMTALITYMRTDSTRISNEAVGAVRTYIGNVYGEKYVPESPNFYKSKKGAQDAHEAIRPTYMDHTPERVAAFLDKDQFRLYTLIWNRFVASQMADALFEQTKIESKPNEGLIFTATGQVPKFNGYLAIYEEGRDEADEDESRTLPSISKGDTLEVRELRGSQLFTQPPPRYTEASLVKELEKRGIGRPSTYASIVSVIQEKEYVEKDESRRFRPTELGYIVTDLLIENFPEVLDVSFTAQMEEKLDEVEEGSRNWKKLLHEFYGGFKERLDAAAKNMRRVKAEATPTDILCDKCGEANMVIKWGRAGRFLACPRYPECKNTREYTIENGETKAVEVIQSDEKCENCGANLIVKSGRHGRFLACPNYPDCKTVKSVKTGVKCPECKTGDLVERSSKRGKLFFSCSNYPNCKFATWNRPVDKPCPKCGYPFLLLRETQKSRSLYCPEADCKYSELLPDVDSESHESSTEAVAG